MCGLQVNASEHQFQNIDQSYLSVTYPFPAVDVAGNYTCVVSGLSTSGLLVRYTQDAVLTVGGESFLSLSLQLFVGGPFLSGIVTLWASRFVISVWGCLSVCQ